MVINKNMHEAMQSLIEINEFVSSETADVCILNGQSVDADNKKIEKVRVNYKVILKRSD